MAGSAWKLEAGPDNDAIETEFEVDRAASAKNPASGEAGVGRVSVCVAARLRFGTLHDFTAVERSRDVRP
jgi:hypothetical protein